MGLRDWMKSMQAPRVCALCQQSFPSNEFPEEGDRCHECKPYSTVIDENDLAKLKEEFSTPPDQVPLIRTPPGWSFPDYDNGRVNLGANLGRMEHFWLDIPTRNRHLYALGKSRTGKTTLLQNIAIQDIVLGHGLGFLDPHGDAIEDLLLHIPESRIDDVVYFDPTSPNCPAFNLLALPYPPDKVVADAVSAFKMFFSDSWGWQLEMILTNSLALLLADAETHSLTDLRRLLLDQEYRATLIERTPSDALRDFWSLQFPTLAKTAINPVLNKLNVFLAPLSPLEKLFSQRENALDFSEIMDGRKIFLVKLAKGELGNDPSRLLGGLIVTALSQAALARVAQPREERTDFFLTVDEFQNYTVASFETILAEAAKYRLNLTLANQNLAQIPATTRASILGNVGTLVVFQCSADDAAIMTKEMRGKMPGLRPKRDEDAARMDEFFDKEFKPIFAPEKNYIMLRGAEDEIHYLPAAIRLVRAHLTQDAHEIIESTHTFPNGETRCKGDFTERLDALLAYAQHSLEDSTVGVPHFFDVEPIPFPEVADLTNQKRGCAVLRHLDNDNVFPMSFRGPLEAGDNAKEIRESILSRKPPASEATSDTSSTTPPPATPKPVSSADASDSPSEAPTESPEPVANVDLPPDDPDCGFPIPKKH